jgi:hypothetical protein
MSIRGAIMSRRLLAAVLLGAVAQLALADALNDCISACDVAYKQCLEDRNPMEQCQLAQKNCEKDCRAH